MRKPLILHLVGPVRTAPKEANQFCWLAFFWREFGCVAHIVRLIDYQVNTKIDPRGVDFSKALIFSQTNNVCNAPFFSILNP